MALFKIHKGSANNLGKTGNITQYTQEGYAYFTTEDGKFYIDIAGDGTTPAQLGINRLPLNAYKADRDEDGNRIATNYVKRTKETKQTISVTGGGTTLRLNSFNKHGSLIEFSNTQSSTNESGETVETQVSLGYLGVWDGSPCYYYNDSSYNILHAGNYSSYALPLSGGTLTGSLSVNGGVQAGSVWGKQTSAEATVGVENKTLNSNLYLYANKSKLGLYCTIGSDVSKNIISIDSAGVANFIGNASTATKATQDGNGNTIASTYLPLSGGTLTGPLSLGNTNWILQDFYTGESSITSRQYGKAHAIQLGIPGRDYMNFYEFGGVFNFYKTNDIYNDPNSISDGVLIAQITPDGFIGNLIGNASTATALSSEISDSKLPARLRENTSETSANPDTFMSSGFYYAGGAGISNVNDANILTIAHTKNSWCHQLGFKFNGTGVSGTSYDGADVYTRIYNGANNAWGNWHALLSSGNYTAYTVTKTGGGASGTWGINITGKAATASYITSLGAVAPQTGRTNAYNGAYTYKTTAGDSSVGAPNTHTAVIGFGSAAAGSAEIAVQWTAGMGVWVRALRDYQDNWYAWKQIWTAGDSITGAVWNDYAEYRESTTTKPGLVVFENGDDSLSPTTERLSHFAGIVSDTWGFCQGETEKAKTPIAVAGRVLAYTYQDRNNYKPGDCVCAAPNGTVDIMTREEVMMYPDRIVGTVSCIPEYEEWGQGDRPAVKVDGRIWVKVK